MRPPRVSFSLTGSVAPWLTLANASRPAASTWSLRTFLGAYRFSRLSSAGLGPLSAPR